MNAGFVVADRFVIERLASQGGMGHVYAAKDRLTGERVALKVVQRQGEGGRHAPASAQHQAEVTRFTREGKVLAELRHPGIVRYVAHGVTSLGEPYLAMEWLEGEDLGDRLTRAGLTLRESTAVVHRAADALAIAHARGLVHRDIKPSNIFLVGKRLDGLKLIDFGLVRAGRSESDLTKTGMMLGTPGYMAPEQVRGSKGLDARADVFALGCVLYKCLTAREPFASEHDLGVVTRILFEEPMPPRMLRTEIPRALEELVLRMLAKPPDQRPADARAVAMELLRIDLPEGSMRFPATARSEALTNHEQRLVSIVLAVPQRSVLARSDRTLTPEQASTEHDTLRALIEARGARFEALSNGAFVAASSGVGTATDQAAQAARCAFVMRDHLHGAPIALATGRSDASSRMPVGEVIDRAVALLGGGVDAAATIVDQVAPNDEHAPPPTDIPVVSADAPLTPPITRIRVDEVTAGLLGARFEIARAGQWFDLVRERDLSEPSRRLLGKETPCVGRERELGALMGFWDECISEPVARAVVVTGDAGMGKSRVRAEFVRRVTERRGVGAIWIARGDPMSAGAPFGMLAQLLRSAAGLRDAEVPEGKDERLRARVARHVAAPEVPRVHEFLRELLTASQKDRPAGASVQLQAARQDPTLMGDQLRRAWEDFLAAECAVEPVLIVLEDLHWGDLPTVKFIDSALRTLEASPLMILALGRPEVDDLFPRLWAERGVHPLHLGELTKSASEKLARHALAAKGDDTRIAALVERAGGNVFYLEELVRAVAEGRGDALPETVLAMMQVRLEGLEVEARRVLRAASVFGQRFWRGGVSTLLGGSEREGPLGEWLAVLVEREFITRRTESRVEGEQEFAFRHSLLRDAAYATLSKSDGALGHKLAGEWLEQVGEVEPLVQAEHFERGGEPGRALAWYRRAAEQALEGDDFAAAIQRSERGLACGATGAILGALRTLEVEAHFWRGDFVEVEEYGEGALATLRGGGPLWFRAAARMVIASGRRGHVERMLHLSELIVEPLKAGLVSREAEGSCAFAMAHSAAQLMFAGHYARAEAIVARVDHLATSRGTADPVLAGWADDARSTRAMMAGDMGACVALMSAAAIHFEEAGDLRQACAERGYVGYGFLDLGMYPEAEVALRDALGTAERMGLVHVVASAKHNLGLVRALRGSIDDAVALERAAIDTFKKQGDRRLESASRKYLARIFVMAGDLDGAETQASLALDVGGDNRPMRASILATLAWIRVLRGSATAALVAAREAHELLAALGVLEDDEALVRISFAEALDATGAHREACAVVAAAKDRLNERAAKISNPAWRARFLEDVPQHARTLSLARAWLTDPTAP